MPLHLGVLGMVAACNQILGNQSADVTGQPAGDAGVIYVEVEGGTVVVEAGPGPAPVEAGLTDCPAGTKRCSGNCITLDNELTGCGDPNSCEPCALPAFATEMYCDEETHACRVWTCADLRDDCDLDPANGCEADLTAPLTCGACRDLELSEEEDEAYCPSPGTCMNDGSSASCCAPGESLCEGYCADLQNDEANCGSCEHECPPTEPACAGATCVAQ